MQPEGSRLSLTAENINEELSRHREALNSVRLPTPPTDVLAWLKYLKREPLGFGPYPHVSVFEAANRIFSDLVILHGVRRLLAKPLVGQIQLPFTRYAVALGVEPGHDLVANTDDVLLIGEAFNVATSFFQSKKYTSKRKLEKNLEADFRLLMFNADAAANPEKYEWESSRDGIVYVPVDIGAVS